MKRINIQGGLEANEACGFSEQKVPLLEPSSPWPEANEAEQRWYEQAYAMGRYIGDVTMRIHHYEAEKATQQLHIDDMAERAKRDDMTGLFTREYLIDEYNKLQEAAPHRRLGEIAVPHALMILDADHFKKINDTYGHDVGDQTLIRLGAIFRQNLKRDSDVVARIGGEEFGVLLPGTPLEHASDVADRLRFAVIEDEALQDIITSAAAKQAGTNSAVLSISIGLTQLQLDQSFRENFRRADEAMYAAKQRGRNMVVIR